MPTQIKICGITSTTDAELCLSFGVDFLGVNLVPSSVRSVELEVAREIVSCAGGRAVVALVVAGLSVEASRDLLESTGARLLQLHGDEPPATLSALLPSAYKAVRIATAADVASADRFAGEPLLVDAAVPGQLGGTGKTVDWDLVRPLAARRAVMLAGGLRPENVAEALSRVRPAAVDVASGVERANEPRRKDRDRVEAFVRAVRDCDRRFDRC